MKTFQTGFPKKKLSISLNSCNLIFYFLRKRRTLDLYAPQKILNNKIKVLRHLPQGCNQCNAHENNDAMIDIFLKDLQHYRTVKGVEDP